MKTLLCFTCCLHNIGENCFRNKAKCSQFIHTGNTKTLMLAFTKKKNIKHFLRYIYFLIIVVQILKHMLNISMSSPCIIIIFFIPIYFLSRRRHGPPAGEAPRTNQPRHRPGVHHEVRNVKSSSSSSCPHPTLTILNNIFIINYPASHSVKWIPNIWELRQAEMGKVRMNRHVFSFYHIG